MLKKQNIFTQIVEAPFWQQLLFCGLLGIIVAAIFQNFILLNLSTKRDRLVKQLQQQTQNIGSLRSFAKNLPASTKTYKDLQKQEPNLLLESDYPEVLVQFSSFSAPEFKINRLEPKASKTEEGIIYKTLFIQAEGRLNNILDFYNQIQKISTTSSIDKLIVKKKKKNYLATFYLTTALSKDSQ